MRRITLTRGRSCAGKVPHPTRDAAQAALDALVRKGGIRLNVYRCRFAQPPHWHVGHLPKPRETR